MADLILKLVFAHLVGDYILQTDFLAKTKGTNLYHMIVHCLLYSLPFYILFGCCAELVVVIVSHFIIDNLKARYGKINYVCDQLLHYLICVICFVRF